jgi:hypothetical protein
MFDYFKKLTAPAWASTLETLGWEKGDVDWVKLGLFIVGFMIVAFLGLAAAVLDLWFLGTVLLIGCCIALPLFYLWNLFVAAYQLDEALRAQLEASHQPKRHFSETVAKKLQTLLAQGNELLEMRANPESHQLENVWAEGIVAWCTHATELIAGNLPRSEAMGFTTVSVFPNADHSQTQLVNVLRTRHETLRQIALRYMEAAPRR